MLARNECIMDPKLVVLGEGGPIVTEEECQEYCSESYEDCNSFVHKKQSKMCYFYKQPVKDMVWQCNTILGPKDPDMAKCLFLNNTCSVSKVV